MKIGIVGDVRVGKTALINAIKGEELKALHEQTLIVSFDRAIISAKKKNISVSS